MRRESVGNLILGQFAKENGAAMTQRRFPILKGGA
jgi:hypothetical protein